MLLAPSLQNAVTQVSGTKTESDIFDVMARPIAERSGIDGPTAKPDALLGGQVTEGTGSHGVGC